MRLLLVFAILAAACGTALAQRSSGAPPVTSTSSGSNAMPPTVGLENVVQKDSAFPKHITGTILGISDSRRLMMIERADKSHLTLNVDPKVRAKADKGTFLAGRKDLSLNDYKPGYVVSITYRAHDNTATEIRLKRPKS